MSADRVAELTARSFDQAHRRASGAFVPLLISQWLAAVIASVTWAPLSWGDRFSTPNVHVYAAVLGGGALTLLPVFLAINRPAASFTRWTIAVMQMLWSALLIHFTAGRAEAHALFFISVAFLALYRDWVVLVPATATAILVHLILGAYWPESLYGPGAPQDGRAIELFLLGVAGLAAAASCAWGARDLRAAAVHQVDAEVGVEREKQRSRELFAAMKELEVTQDALARAGKLAVAGQLATTLGNELQIPLAAIQKAQTALSTALQQSGARTDVRINELCREADHQLETCIRVVRNLLDHAREHLPALQPCSVRELVADAIETVSKNEAIHVSNLVSDTLPQVSVDRDQLLQALVHLLRNAVEATPPGGVSRIVVSAWGGGSQGLSIKVSDSGVGISEAVLPKIFQPLFSTKQKGTGLGLAVVATVVKKHGGKVNVKSAVGQGSDFVIELPASKSKPQAA